MRYSIFTITILFLLSACGGGGDGGDNGSKVDDATIAGAQAFLQRLAGTWNSSVEREQGFDESYTIIQADGSVVEYDYQGDSFNMGQNCWTVKSFRLIPESTNAFQIEGIKVRFDLFDADKLVTLRSSVETINWSRVQEGELSQDAFTPEC